MNIQGKIISLTVLILAISIAGALIISNQMVPAEQEIWVISGIAIAGLIIGIVGSGMISSPIKKLRQLANDMSEGKKTEDIHLSGTDEIGMLAQQLSTASQKLTAQLAEERKLNEKLEAQKNKIDAQKRMLEHVNKQMSDSIMYAQRIQRSILPEPKAINRLVKDLFVFYQPKDVVSGDFYWFERVRQGRNEYLIVACADCTGHGVPGAIMSIMGANQLTNIVYYQNYLDPQKILARLDKVIKFELQRESGNPNRDGLEIGICVIDLDDLSMEFSGVGIPLMMIKNGQSEIESYKSPKYMIGGIEGDEKEVSSKLQKVSMQLEEGDKIYMASDGFKDQFGGPNDKRYMSKRLKELIVSNSQLPMSEQRSKMEESFKSWKKETPQTDDVLVVGVEI